MRTEDRGVELPPGLVGLLVAIALACLSVQWLLVLWSW